MQSPNPPLMCPYYHSSKQTTWAVTCGARHTHKHRAREQRTAACLPCSTCQLWLIHGCRPQAMEPSAVTSMIQGVWDGMSPAYDRFVDESMMAPAASLVVAAVKDHWANQINHYKGEPRWRIITVRRSQHFDTRNDSPLMSMSQQGHRPQWGGTVGWTRLHLKAARAQLHRVSH